MRFFLNILYKNQVCRPKSGVNYYPHGPLARIEYGDNHVQGQDFAYTLQGWVKGINSTNLTETNDMGQDGKATTVNGNFARDAYSYSLRYFNGDYKAISNPSVADNFIASTSAASYLNTDAPSLYNGNIASSVTTLKDINPLSADFGKALPQLSAYRYDQLNRVVQMKAYRDINLAANTWGNGSSYDGSYETHVSYDANGNILSMQRNGVAGVNLNMDDMTYTYENEANGYARNTNKLRHVNDNTGYTSNYANDLDDQGAFSLGNENYAYDEIGQQTQDKSEEIALQEWNSRGKVKSITRSTGSTKPDLEFNYNARGQRISKIVKPRDVSGLRPMTEWVTTYYVKDFEGNTMAVYEQSYDSSMASFKVKERYIYGTTRLGADKTEVEMIGAFMDTTHFAHITGNKNYDLMNWRNDIVTTITDRKIAIEDTLNPGTIAYYEPEIITTNETYPYGMPQPLRSAGLTESRNGYQTQESIDEINGKPKTHYTAEYWEYNALTGRRENPDPKPDAWESVYAAFASNPVFYSDIQGDTEDERKKAVAKAKEYESKSTGTSDSYGGKGDPGKAVDCSGLASKCIEAADLPNPNEGSSNGVTNIANNTTKVEWNDIQEGNVVTFNNNKHIGIISGNIEKDKDGNVTSFSVIGSQSSTGPAEFTVFVNKSSSWTEKTADGKRKNDGYWSPKLGAAYKWDTNDDGTSNISVSNTSATNTSTQPVITNTNSNAVVQTTASYAVPMVIPMEINLAPAVSTQVVMPTPIIPVVPAEKK